MLRLVAGEGELPPRARPPVPPVREGSAKGSSGIDMMSIRARRVDQVRVIAGSEMSVVLVGMR